MPKDSKNHYSTSKSEAKRSLKWLVVSTLISTSLVFFVGFAYVNSLWSQKYLQGVQDHWEMSPIVDVKFVNLKDQNSKPKTVKCPDGYEVATSGVFDGHYAGCDCTVSKRGIYTGLRLGYCNRNETDAGCRIIDKQEPISF